MASERSRNYLVDILVILVLATASYAGYKLIPIYIDNYRLKDDVRNVMVKVHRHTKGQELKRDLREAVKKHDLILEDDDIVLNFGDQNVRAKFEYDRVVPIPGTKKAITIHFTIDDEKDLRMM